MRMLITVAVLGTVVCVGCGQPVSPAGPSPVVAAGGSVDSGAESVPFRGSLEGTQTVTPLTPPLVRVDGEAAGHATLLGRFTVRFPHTVDPTVGRGEGTYTFIAANGDALSADFTGVAQLGPIVSIVETAVITGGTGRFAGAAGSFTARRQFNPATGVTTGTFEGTISAAGAIR